MLVSQESNSAKFFVLIGSFIAVVLCIGYNLTSLAILLPQWSETMDWTMAQTALIAGAMPMGNVITVWATGILSDKFKAKNLMILAIVLNGAIMFCRGFISDFTTAYVILFISGITTAIIVPSALKLANTWWDRRSIYKVNGVLFSGGAIGYFIGFNGTIPWSIALGGWDRVFQAWGVIIIALAVFWILLCPHRTEEQGAMNKDLEVAIEGYSAWKKIKECLQSKQVMLCIIAELFIAGAILTFASVGPIAFLGIWAGITAMQAGFIVSMSNIGSTIGYLTLPAIADKLGYRKRLTVPAALFSIALYAWSPFTGNIVMSCIIINIAGFFNGWGLVGARTLMMEHPDVAGIKAGTAAGFLQEMNQIGCVVFPLIFAAIFNVAGVQTGWLTMFAVGMLGVIFLLFAKETGRRAVEKAHRVLEQVLQN